MISIVLEISNQCYASMNTILYLELHNESSHRSVSQLHFPSVLLLVTLPNYQFHILIGMLQKSPTLQSQHASMRSTITFD